MCCLILDFDGTIHNTEKIYVPAFREGYKFLSDGGFVPPRSLADEEITDLLGLTPKDAWEKMSPGLDSTVTDKVSRLVSGKMKRLTEQGASELYNGAEDALRTLRSRGYRLLFLSNCFRSYMELHRKAHRLDRFFEDYYCSEDFGFISKPEIFEKIRGRYKGDFIVVGDRYLDLEIARVHGLKSVGCTYGYAKENELVGADILISDISQLPQAVEKLAKK